MGLWAWQITLDIKRLVQRTRMGPGLFLWFSTDVIRLSWIDKFFKSFSSFLSTHSMCPVKCEVASLAHTGPVCYVWCVLSSDIESVVGRKPFTEERRFPFELLIESNCCSLSYHVKWVEVMYFFSSLTCHHCRCQPSHRTLSTPCRVVLLSDEWASKRHRDWKN